MNKLRLGVNSIFYKYDPSSMQHLKYWRITNIRLFTLNIYESEFDISVSKLLDFETFAKSLRVWVSVSENLVSEKKSQFRFRKNLVAEKSLSLGFGKFGLRK